MIDYERYKFLKVEKKEKIAIVTMNHPDQLNAIGVVEHPDLINVMADLNKDEEVYAVILTGAGRAFSAGGDVNLMKALLEDPSLRPPMSEPRDLIYNIINLRKPIIAAVNGDAVGLGATIALHCDIIIAAEDARIGDPHVRVSLAAGDGGCIIWPLLIGMCKAKQYLMTGDLIKAPEAERLGLINKAVPKEKLMDEAWKMAKRFADGPIQAIVWTKMILNKILQSRADLLIDASIGYEYHSMYLPDHAEAVHAFLEKKAPKFTGGQV